MMASEFGTIRPGDIDSFTFDFTDAVEPSNITTPVIWTCDVSPESTLTDPTPELRIIGAPTFVNANASLGVNPTHITTCRVGQCLDGVIYRITASIVTVDGRALSRDADLSCTLHASPEDPILTVDQFRAEFPAMSDPTKFPDEQVNFWISQALNNSPLDPNRWGQFYDLGLRLYIAHNLLINRQMGLSIGRGGSGIGSGVPQSKSVNGVSVSYNLEFGSEKDAGNFGLTIYGSQFIRLARQAGMGPIQL